MDYNTKGFWARVNKSVGSGCWLWTGELWRGGYGMHVIDGKPNSAHRISFLIAKKHIPRGHVIRHTCDIRRCVNPAHLISGTQHENVMDMFKRGRARKPGGEIKKLNTHSKALVCSYYLPREDKERITRLAAQWCISTSKAISLLIRTVGEHMPGGPGGSLKVVNLRKTL